MTKEHYIVLPLLSFVVLNMGFLFVVSYSGATFNGAAKPIPTPFALQNISEPLAQDTAVIGQNFVWSVQTAFEAVKVPALAYLGIPSNSASAAMAANTSDGQANVHAFFVNPEVLGAVYANPAYVNSTISPSSQ